MVLMFVDLLTRLSQANVLIGIILGALGLGLVLVARKMAKIYNNNNENDDNKIYLVCKGLGLTMICVAMLIMIFY